jgi:hypothetical protein
MNSRLFFLSALMMLFAWNGHAQTTPADTLKKESYGKRFVPTGVRLGTDVISLIKDRRQADFYGWEVNGDVDFHRYLVSVEYGRWGRDFYSDSASYHNDGSYWRAGIDANFLTRDPDRNIFFIGFR